MPFEAYKIYQQYEPDKYKTSVQKKAEEVLKEAGTEIKTESEIDFERAKEILGKDFLGPEQIKKAFGIEIDTEKIPEIPLSKEDLERAKELNQFLVLRANKDREANLLTAKCLRDILKDEFIKENKGKITVSDSYDKKFWEDDPIELKWALVSKEIIPKSTNKNYLEQTELLVDYVKNQVFKDKELLPKEYQEAVEEFHQYLGSHPELKTKDKEKLSSILNDDNKWQQYAEELSELKINQLTRQTPAEFLYNVLIYFQNNNERLLENKYTFTRRRSSDGRLVYIGDFASGGAYVFGCRPGYSRSYLGVSFSRSL